MSHRESQVPLLRAVPVLALLVCSAALASEEDYALWTSLTFVCRPSKPFPETTVQVQTGGEGKDRRITSLRVSNKDFDMRAPHEALADLAVPMLDTLRLSTEAGYDKTPWMYITFALGNPRPGQPWDFPTVYLKIRDGRLVGRSLKRRAGDQVRYEDLPYGPATRPAKAPAAEGAGAAGPQAAAAAVSATEADGRTAADEAVVDCSRPGGTIRPLHGVNNGPLNYGETVDLSAYYRQAGFPLARLHDSEWPSGDLVDMHAVFPDLRADPNRPESYRFARSDDYVRPIIDAGVGVVYRLGESIETTRRKHHVAPPADYDKWAAACIGIIRHYNEGWANGFRHNIRYWEIWNEPENRPAMWTGTDEDYYRLYATAARRIKARFGDVMVGGPSAGEIGRLAGERLEPTPFIAGFLGYCAKHAAPLDFFSWHTYCDDPSLYVAKARAVRKLLDDRGFAKAEIHLNEWNYLPRNDWKPLGLAGQGAGRQEWFQEIGGPAGAAFLACTLVYLQDSPVTVANYYSGDINQFGLFTRHGVPNKTFHAMRAFRMLLDAPLRVEASGARPGESAVCAGLNRDRTGLTVLAANYRSRQRELDLLVRDIPWRGPVRWEVLRLDAKEDLRPVRAGTSEDRPLRLKVDWEAPCVLLIRLIRPAGLAARGSERP